jgi:hypothetical protein
VLLCCFVIGRPLRISIPAGLAAPVAARSVTGDNKITQAGACFTRTVRYDAGITHKISPARHTDERRSAGMRPAIRNQCIVITVFSIAAVGLIQLYLPRGGAPEYSLIGAASRIGGLTGHRQ